MLAVVLLSLVLGLHWAALQSVAWATMFVERVQRSTVTEALQTTFDGKHPCALCRAVKEGRAAEQSDPAAPSSGGAAGMRLDLVLASAPGGYVASRPSGSPPIAPSLHGLFRSDPPPLPPPRAA